MKRAAALTTEIVRIGNSKGIRIPKAIREQAGLAGKVSLLVSGGALVIRSARMPRCGWDKAFEGAAKPKRDAADD